MGRKKHSVGLGKSIIRDRFGKRTAPKGDNFLHTSELKDGYDWGRLNLQSVTEQSNLEDFLTTAELAGTEFTAEKLNVQFVDPQRTSGLLSSDEQSRIHKLHEEHKGLIRIPRRPSWNENTTPEELDRDERNSFLEWRRALSALQDIEGIVLTPYEKNLDFWRQLWRVIERSDVIVQVVDARNPLLFRCEDVEKYVNEVDSTKVNLVLINKADFLSDHQRQLWCDHFDQRNIRVAFWSALNETERQASNESGEGEEDVVHNESDPDTESDDEDEDDDDDDDDDDEDSETQEIGPDELCDNKTDDDESVDRRKDESVAMETEGARSKQNCDVQPDKLKQNVNTDFKEDRLSHNQEHPDMETAESAQNEINVSDSGDGCNCPTGGVELDPPKDTTAEICNKSQNTVSESDELNTVSSANVDMTDKNSEISSGATGGVQNDIKILDGPELLNLFRKLHTGEKVQNGVTTIGMVGYPNVGKSSTINAILKMKKVPVSATPGRTKHFQTLYVDKDLMLCDCPGLVFPSFVSTKAELIVNGILPIDQMRDHVPPVSLVCHHIPKDVLETTYGVNIPPPPEEEDPDRHPTADEFLNAYGSMRGFMTARGLPDCPRSSRYILKDYVNGRLLYCNPPPDVDVQLFKPTVGMTETIKLKQHKSSGTKQAQPKPLSKVDREFFRKVDSCIHSKGPGGMSNFARTQGLQQVGSTSSSGSTPYSSMQSLSGKPWKKHNNRGKKEKLRRVFNEQDLI